MTNREDFPLATELMERVSQVGCGLFRLIARTSPVAITPIPTRSSRGRYRKPLVSPGIARNRT